MSARRLLEIVRLAERDMDLLAGGADVEPGEGFALQVRDGARCEAEGVGVEGRGEMEGLRGDDEVDVVEAGDHVGGGGGGGGVGALGRVVGRCEVKYYGVAGLKVYP